MAFLCADRLPLWPIISFFVAFLQFDEKAIQYLNTGVITTVLLSYNESNPYCAPDGAAVFLISDDQDQEVQNVHYV